MSGFLIAEAALGASDCEQLRAGLVAQPVNAVSSLAYIVVGSAIISLSRRSGPWRARSIVFGACVVATGVGSVAYHGPQTPGSQLIHDVSIDLVLALVALHGLSLLVPRLERELVAFAVFAVVLTAASLVVRELPAIVAGVLVVAVIAIEVLVYGRRLRARERRMLAAITIVMLTAGVMFVLGRTGGPLCVATSTIQPHAAWHIATAFVVGLWWQLALATGPGDRVALVSTRP